jgi:multidrug resistance efflux pump
MRRGVLALLAGGLLALGFSVGSGGCDRGDAVSAAGIPAVQARLADFNHTIRVLGTLRPEKTTRVTSELNYLKVTKVIPEGSQVRKGDVLVELDTTSSQEDILTAKESMATGEADLASARATFEKAKVEIEAEVKELEAKLAVAEARFALEQSKPLPEKLLTARAQLDQATAGWGYAGYWLETTRALFDEGVLGRRDVRSAELSHHSASLDRQQAEKALAEITKGAKPEDLESARAKLTEARVSLEQAAASKEQRIEQAESAVKSAENAVGDARRKLAQLEEDLSKAHIKAPHDGTAFAPGGTKVTVGDYAWRGRTLVELADTSSLLLQGKAQEADSRLVSVGQAAVVHLLAFPDGSIPGVVAKVGDALTEDEGNPKLKHLEVEVKLERVPEGVRPRMTGYAEVVVEHVPKAVVIPCSSVRDGFVMVVDQGKLHKRKVEVRASDAAFAAIRSGLREGEWVCRCPEE